MPLITCKVELKLWWTKYCVLSVAGTDTSNGYNNDNIIFTVKDMKLYVPVVTLSVRDNQKLSKLLSKGFERPVHSFFLELNFDWVNELFVLVYTNQVAASKRVKAKRYYSPKGIIDYCNLL